MNSLIPNTFNVQTVVSFDKENTTTVLIMVFVLVIISAMAIKLISKI